MDFQDQVNEIAARLKKILPVVANDRRFKFGAVKVESELIPVVYLSEEQGIGYGIPRKFIYILKKGDDLYAMLFDGFYDVTHFLVPTSWWPGLVSSEELDRLIIEIFEGWLNYCEEVEEYKKAYSRPDITSLPL